MENQKIRKGFLAETRYIAELPSWRQKEVKRAIQKQARELELEQSDIDNALNSQLCDLSDLIGKNKTRVKLNSSCRLYLA